AAPFRKILILQTDGTVCTMQTAYTQITPAQSRLPTYVPNAVASTHGNSSSLRSENRAMDTAWYMRNTPDAFQGVEIFTIMFCACDGSNSCWDATVFDTGTSLSPACRPDTSTLPAVSSRSHVDDYMIALSSSASGTCDHYIPATKNNSTALTNAYRDILKKIAVGK